MTSHWTRHQMNTDSTPTFAVIGAADHFFSKGAIASNTSSPTGLIVVERKWESNTPITINRFIPDECVIFKGDLIFTNSLYIKIYPSSPWPKGTFVAHATSRTPWKIATGIKNKVFHPPKQIIAKFV